MTKHLAIFKGDAAVRILSGQKTVETRFSRLKIPPFCLISTGDLVYVKPSGKEPIGQFRVQKVIFYDGLNYQDILEIKKLYAGKTAVGNEYWERKKDARYGTIIFVGTTAKFITSPVKFTKRDLRGWVVLG